MIGAACVVVFVDIFLFVVIVVVVGVVVAMKGTYIPEYVYE